MRISSTEDMDQTLENKYVEDKEERGTMREEQAGNGG